MSELIATVKKIENCDSLNIVEFNCNGQVLTMMSLELSKNIKLETKVNLVVKPTHITIASNYTGEISCSNKLATTISAINNGKLLSSIKLSFLDITLEAIITAKSSKDMNLKVGDEVVAFIKASELSIQSIIND